MMINQNSMLTTLVNQSSSVRQQLSVVQQQIASGYVSTTYSGLGNQARAALSLAPQLAHQTTWTNNINAAQGRLTVTQDAVTSIQGVASDFFAQVNQIDAQDPTSLQSIVVGAKAALTQVANYLNSKSGDAYVFSGTDTSNPPVTTTDPTTLANDLLSSSTPSSPPFSSTIGTSAPKVETGDGQWTSVGLLANQNTYATSGAPTTGSCMRDVMTALASLTTLTPSNASSVAAGVRAQLSSAITALSTEAGGVAATSNTLKQQQTDLSTFSATLQTQLSSAEDVDMAAAITKSSTLQTQLQASYQIISNTQSLSLAKFL